MIKTSYNCNSLSLKHFLCFLFSFRKKKGASLFINQISQFFSIKERSVFLFGSARMSIYSIIEAMGWTKDSEIIVAGYTCVVVTNAISYSGLEAVYVDISEDNLNIDTEKLLKQITDKTKAIIVTHNFGIPYEDIDRIKELHPNILIIEDAAHTLSSLDSKGRKLGLIGDAAFFSLEYSKPISTGMGGFLIVNNPELLEKLDVYYRELKKYPSDINLKIIATLFIHLITSYKYTIWLKWGLLGILDKLGGLFKSSPEELNGMKPKLYPVKLSAKLALSGHFQMKDIDRINRIKDGIVSNYSFIFSDLKGVKQFYNPDINYVRYPLLFDKDISQDQIDLIKESLKSIGILPGVWFNDVIHPAGSYKYCYIDGSCPNGESISKRILNLPVNIHNKLREKDFHRIQEIFNQNLK